MISVGAMLILQSGLPCIVDSSIPEERQVCADRAYETVLIEDDEIIPQAAEIKERYRTYIDWRSCLVDQASALARHTTMNPDAIVTAAVDGCMYRQIIFREAVDATGSGQDIEDWFNSAVDESLVAALNAAEGQNVDALR